MRLKVDKISGIAYGADLRIASPTILFSLGSKQAVGMHIAYTMLHSNMFDASFSKCTNAQIALLISKFSHGMNIEANFSSLLNLQ